VSRLVDQHRQAYAYCAYCPKVCRFACPVSDATQTETTSTWGKMTEAFLVTGGKRSLEPGGARALYACTGCMRCRSFCAHNNEVGFALFSARRTAIDRELAPPGALSTLETFRRRGNPFGKDLSEVRGRHSAGARVRLQLYPGCSVLAKRPELVEDALEVSGKLGTPLGVSESASRCCGYPLYAAGDTGAFEAHARRTAQALSGQPELAVLDPGCAYTFRVVYPRMGIDLQCSVRTLVEVLSERVDDAFERPPLDEAVAYHDACHLGRGLGQYDEPRRLLRAAVRAVHEAREKEEEAGCSGGGGLLPRTMPETAVEIAQRQADRIAGGGESIVTACPTSRRMFERAGRRSEDLLSVLRRWLEDRR
jgi:dimethylglycine catabolism B